MHLDRADRKILRELQRDARQSNAALAAHVGLSESACLRRVRLLEQAGVIERYTAMLNPTKVGVTAILTVLYCEVLSFATFFLGTGILSGGGAPSANLGSPGAAFAILTFPARAGV